MKFLSNLFGEGLGKVVNLVDDLTLSKEEKQQFKLQLQSQLMQQEKLIEDTYRQELTSRTDIIKAEMAQGDNYTKRARPTIIYAGLLFICIVYVIVPVLAYISGTPQAEMPTIELPDQFWWAWGTVVGVYGAGRSAEKLGVTNKLTNAITGSNAHKVEEAKG